MEEEIKIGDKVRVENLSDSFRLKKGFEDFEGKVKSIYAHVFGYSGEIETKDQERKIRVFDSEVHRLVKLNQ